MRTTVRIDDELLREAKRAAAAGNKTLTELVEEALRETLARRASTATRERVRLPTFDGGGLQPGVDLDDSAALLELMDEADAAP